MTIAKRILLVAVLLLSILLSGCSTDGSDIVAYTVEINGIPETIEIVDYGTSNGVSLNAEADTVMCAEEIIFLRVDFTSKNPWRTASNPITEVDAKTICELGQLWLDQILEPLVDPSITPAP